MIKFAFNKLLNITQKYPLDVWFFFLFLFSFFLSIRKVLRYFPIKGTFNEYTGIYVYMSDIFFFLTILVWMLLLLYNNIIFSSNKTTCKLWITCYIRKIISKLKFIFCLTIKDNLKMFHVEHFNKTNLLKNWYLSLPLGLISLSFISILWSINQNTAVYRSIKLLEYFLVYIYLIYRIIPLIKSNKKNFSLASNSIKILILIAIINSIIAILQFFFQQSLGLYYLKESIISADAVGIAKVIFHGDKYIRAYGLFPHPNILGGFLCFSIILTLFWRKYNLECSTWNILNINPSKIIKNVPRGTFFTSILLLQIVALLLTFSKSAYLGLVIAIYYLYFRNVPRGTFPFKRKSVLKMFHVEHFKKLLLLFIIFFLILFLSKLNLSDFLLKSLEERLLYLNVSRGTILNNILLGIGQGQFINNMEKYSNFSLQQWQFQPVHNVFLLVWSELGIFGFFIFSLFLYKLLQDYSVLYNKLCIMSMLYSQAILWAFLFIMLFDHYFWDIQPGSVVFWLVSGIIAGLKRNC